MKHLWRIARYEYQRNVFKKSFLLMILGMPAMIAFSICLGVFLEASEDNPRPVGYVDLAGVCDPIASSSEMGAAWTQKYPDPVMIIPFAGEEPARDALAAGDIQMYYLLPADYRATRHVVQFTIENPGQNAERQFFDFLQLNLLASQPPEIADRVAAGTSVTVRSLDGRRTIPAGGPTFGLMMPLFITFGFLVLIMVSSGYTMSAVAEEKENRTMEVLVTSVSPGHLIAGKILGILAIGLTLIASWGLVVTAGLLTARLLGIPWFQNLELDWSAILAILAVAIPAYALAIALMTAIGAMVTSTQEGQSVSSIFFIMHMAPMYISMAFVNDPHSPLAVLLSILPITSLMSIGMRNLFTIVPTWQILASMVVQVFCALFAIWLAGRSLRLGMLRYGQRLPWRALFGQAQ